MERLHRNEGKQVLRKCWKKRGFVLLVGVVLATVQVFGNITLCKAAQLTRGDGAIEIYSDSNLISLEDISPNGNELLLLRQDSVGNSNLWLYNLKTKNLSQLTRGTQDSAGKWIPKMDEIIYTEGGRERLALVPVNGGAPRILYEGPKQSSFAIWWRGGSYCSSKKQIIVSARKENTKLMDLYAVDIETGKWELFYSLQPQGCYMANCSPDGSKIAFVALNPPTEEYRQKSDWVLHILTLPDMQDDSFEEIDQVSSMPRFSPDGKWVTYLGCIPRKFRKEWNLNDYNIYLFSLEGKKSIQVTKQGGKNPVFTPDGNKILFECESKIYSIVVP